MQIPLVIGAVVVIVVLLGWLGLQVQPSAFAPVTQAQGAVETVPLPRGLPAPVERWYRLTYNGDTVPVYKTVVVSGRGTIRPIPSEPRLPIRFRFTHDVGKSYRHYIEATWFGLPFLKVNEYYYNGKERMELGSAISENNPKLDQGGNLGMWAELIQWAPAALLTDSRVQWQAVDDETAILVVPFGTGSERFVVRFDPDTGKMVLWEVMRYKNGEGSKVLWLNGRWLDEGSPWAEFTTEQVVVNVPVQTSPEVKGP